MSIVYRVIGFDVVEEVKFANASQLHLWCSIMEHVVEVIEMKGTYM